MKEYLAGEDIANRLRMLRSHPHNYSLAFLLVEGGTDAALFRNFADDNACKVIPAHGRDNVVNCLMLLEATAFPGVLAIVDADFSVLEGKLPVSPNLLLTDTHDLETMILQSQALEKMLNAYGSEEKIASLIQASGKDIRTILVECALPVGYLLWLSLRENLALRFEDLDFSKFIHKDTLIIDRVKLIKTVKDHTYNSNTDRARKLLITNHPTADSLELLQRRENDPWHVCRGHDLMRILSIGLGKAIGTCAPQDVKPETLEKNLRLAFEFAHFCKTRLYLSIRVWEQANKPYLVLRQET